MSGHNRPPSPSSIPVRQGLKAATTSASQQRNLPDIKQSLTSKRSMSPARNQSNSTRIPTPTWSRRQSLEKPVVSSTRNEYEADQDDLEKSGVMYISENLIKRITKEEDLKNITHLSLTLSKETNRKIKYMENLDGLVNLHHLSLAHNMIEKIEKLDKLTKLQGLDLSHNQIRKIEGLENLSHLQVLNLNGNMISILPTTLWKKLVSLRAIKLAMNDINSTHELLKLTPLHDLTDIAIDGNPFCSMPHHREVIICHLRSLEAIDSIPVTYEDREEADRRYGQDELKELSEKLSQVEKELNKTRQEKVKSEGEMHSIRQNEKKLKISLEESKQKMKKLHDELQAKDELINTKNIELSKACEKQYKLEQELAFFKLDAKFDELWKAPVMNYEADGDEYMDGGESTYLGKARFKPNAMAREHFLPTNEQVINFVKYCTSENPEARERNKEVIRAIEEALQIQLDDKQEAIDDAEKQLQLLQSQLEETEQQIQEAHMNQSNRREQDVGPQALGDIQDRDKARQHLIDMIKQAKELQETIKHLQEKLQEVEEEKELREKEIAKLNDVISTLAEDDINIERLRAQVAARERQLKQNILEKEEIEQLMQEAEEELERQVKEIRELEARLREGDKDAQGQIRKELEAVVEKLKQNLDTMKEREKIQQKKFDELKRDRDRLHGRLQETIERSKEMEERMLVANGLQGDVKKLLDKLSGTESELMAEKGRKEKLQAEYDALYKRLNKKKRNIGVGSSDVWNDPTINKLESQLKHSNNELAKLQDALSRAKKQNESERNALENKLREERSRLEDAVDAARLAGDKEKEAKELGNHVRSLKAEVANLRDRLASTQDDLNRELEESVPNQHVLEQVDTLLQEISQGHVNKYSPVLSSSSRERITQKPFERLRGEISDIFNELEMMKDDKEITLERMMAEKDLLKEKLGRAEEKTKSLASELSQAQGRLDSAHDNFLHLEGEMKRIEAENVNKSRQQENEANETQRRFEEARERADKAEKDLQLSERKLSDAERRTQEADNEARKLARDLDQSRGELDRLQRELKFLKDKFVKEQGKWKNQAEAEAARAEELVRAMSEDVAQLQRELERSKTNGENMRKMLDQYRLDNDELIRNLQRSNKERQDKLADTQYKLEKAEKDNRELKDATYTLEDDVEKLRYQLQQLRDGTENQLQSERAKYAEEMRSLGKEMDDTRDQIKKLKDYYEDQLNNLESEKDTLQAHLKDAKGKLRTFEEDREKLLRMNHELDSLRNAFRLMELGSRERDNLKSLYGEIAREVERLAEEVNLMNKRSLDAEHHAEGMQRQTAQEIAEAQDQIAALQEALLRKEEELQTARHVNSPLIDAQREEISSLLDRLREKNAELDILRRRLEAPGSRVMTPSTKYIVHEMSHRSQDRTPGEPLSPTVEVHHHHYGEGKERNGMRELVTEVANTASQRNPVIVHHHHNTTPKKKKKKKKTRQESQEDEFCNIAGHEDLEDELDILEEKLDRSLDTNRKALLSGRSPLNLELRALEEKVNNAIVRRAMNRKNCSFR